MKATSAPMAVGDYCQAMSENQIIVNRDYQRNSQIWKSEARSFFVESILLGYPIPKLFLFSKLDLKSRRSIKEIVDGQQRSSALLDFFNNKFRLSKNIDTEELKGQNYNQIDETWQESFLSYSLPIDQFAGVNETEVRETFRRMNSNNIPLNDEEKRNAQYQGHFKWLVHKLAGEYKDSFYRAGLVTKRDLIRMADYKLIADVAYAVRHGIHTTKSKELDSIYRELDKDFSDEDQFRATLEIGIKGLLGLEQYYNTVLFKAHVSYGLILANIALEAETSVLTEAIQSVTHQHPDAVHYSLDDLVGLLDSEDESANLHPFVASCLQKTNVKEPRQIRITYFYHALRKRKAGETDE